MTDIYRSAARVIIRVGKAVNDSSLALSTFVYLGQQITLTRDELRLRHLNAVHPDWFNRSSTLPFDATIWQAIENVVRRS
jgi:hypothetical protein